MRKIFEKLGGFIVGHPAGVIAAAVFLTLGLGAGTLRLVMDADMTDDIPSTIPEKAFFDEVGKVFPANDVLVIAFSDSRGVYSPESLAQVSSWTERIERIDNVKGVLSLSNATMITGTDDGLVIEKAMTFLPRDAAEAEAFRNRIEASGMAEALIGRDGLASTMMVSIDPASDMTRRPRLTLSLPEGFQEERTAVLAQELADLPEALSADPAFRIYDPGNPEDVFDAASLYALRIDGTGRGKTLLLRPGSGADLKALAKTAKELVKGSGIQVTFSDSQVSMYDRIMRALDLLPRSADGRVYVSGSKAVTSVVSRLMVKDLSTLFPVVIALIVAILFLSFRSLRGVLLPLANVIMATVMAMGFMGWLGQPISMATMVLPIILIAVGTAYAIHVINRYNEDVSLTENRGEAIVSTLSHVAVPILFAALTTMIGFASLAVSSIDALKAYGILAAAGILFALVLAVTFTPAVLTLLKKPSGTRAKGRKKTLRPEGKDRGGFLGARLESLGRLTAKRPGPVLAACLAVTLLASLGIPRIVFESNTVESFKRGTEIREASEYFNDNFTGITMMTVIVKAPEEGAILDPGILSAMDGLEEELSSLRYRGKKVFEMGQKGYDEGEDLVGGTQSIVTFVKGINKALHGDDSAWDKVPEAVTEVGVTTERYELAGSKDSGFELREIDSDWGDLIAVYPEGGSGGFTRSGNEATLERDGILRRIDLATGKATDLVDGRTYAGQLVFQYENSGDPEDIESFIDNPRQTARINVFLRSGSSTVSRQVQSLAREWIADRFPEGTRADITGLAALNLTIMDLLVKTQIWSILTSLGVIFLLVSLKGRSFVEGLVSILPLGASLTINFGVMGFAGIPVDISTATIASIAIGIGIDYTLHFMERYRIMRETLDAGEGIVATMGTTGKGIVYNAAAVAGGFIALTASGIRGNVYMGALMALIMIVASAFALTLLPAVLMLFRPSFAEGRRDSHNQGVAQ